MGFFAEIAAILGPWSWWVLGLVLAMVEVLAPGTFFIWFAVAAILTGTVALMVDLGWQAEILLFVALAVVAALAGRRIYGRSRPAEENRLNDRAARQVGRLAVLDTAIAEGTGHIRLDDTRWRVEGPDLPAGAKVRIVAFRDGRLQVEPA
jgi:membrane protein implicated in regulation of membrane protease activity